MKGINIMGIYDFWNILFLVLALTGALCWACMILMVWFIWLTDLRSEE